jgi:hypothetical protein
VTDKQIACAVLARRLAEKMLGRLPDSDGLSAVAGERLSPEHCHHLSLLIRRMIVELREPLKRATRYRTHVTVFLKDGGNRDTVLPGKPRDAEEEASMRDAFEAGCRLGGLDVNAIALWAEKVK